jgi:hypothetical protein
MPAQIGAASQSVLDGLDFYRLFQGIGPGDIFEIDESTRAIFVGPDSDINEFRLYYLDRNAPASTQIADISPGVPFLGRLDALMGQQYPAGPPGRIVLQTTVVLPPLPATPGATGIVPDAIPGLPAPDADSIFYYLPPVIDVFAYTGATPGGIPTTRNPIIHRQAIAVFDNQNPTYLLLPAYGRRLADVRVTRITAFVGAPHDVDVAGLLLVPPVPDPPTATGITGTLIGSGVLGVVASDQVHIVGFGSEVRPTNTTDGFYDYLVVAISGDAVDPGDAVLPNIVVTVTLAD